MAFLSFLIILKKLPNTPSLMSITFKNIVFNANNPILKNLSSTIKNKQMTAIIGPSGSGKTTISKILSGRFTNKYTGSIYYNDKIMSKKALMKLSAYVHQDDYFYEAQTVEETINFVCLLRNKKIDENLINTLNLGHIMKSKIGDSNKGISAGERKRLKILLELIDDKDVIFLDEPTSGLDSLNALKLIELLKTLDMTVCAVLHQPSTHLFFLFDEIIVMSEGNIVYQGSPKDIFKWFECMGKSCPVHYNPADFIFTDILPNMIATTTHHEKHNDYNEISPIGLTNMQKINKKPIQPRSREVKLLMGRSWKEFSRNKMRGFARIGQSIFTAFILAIVFYDCYNKDYYVKLKNLQGVLYYYGLSFLFSAAYSSLTDFFQNERITERELQASYYSFFSFFVSKIVFDTLVNITHPIILVSLVSLAMKYDQTAYKLLVIYVISILTAITGHSISVVIASISSSVIVATAVLSSALLPLTIIGGLFVDPQSMFFVLKILQYVSPTRYAFNAYIKNEFAGETVDPTMEVLVSGFMGIWPSVICMFLIYAFNITISYFLLRKRIYKKL